MKSKPINKSNLTNSNHLKRSLGLIVAALGFLLYVQTIGYSFVLDDASSIKQNRIVQEGIRGIGTLIHTPYRYGYWDKKDELYRPLSLIMFAVEWQFLPDSSTMFHFINVLLYCITGYLLFRLISRLFNNNLVIPFIASLLFIAHPVHTEVAAYIKSGDEILCFLFCIITINLILDYLITGRLSKLIFASITLFLALLAKETAITMILIIPMILFFFKEYNRSQFIKITGSLIIVTGVYLLMRANALGGIINTNEIASVDNILAASPDYLSRFSTAVYVLGKYLLLLTIPIHLSIDYSASEITILKGTDYRFLIALIIYLALFVYAIIRLRKKDVITFCILFYLITISVVSNLFVIIGTVMADRLLFIPSMGFCLLIAVLLTKLFQSNYSIKEGSSVRGFIGNNKRIFFATSLLLAFYSIKTWSRNPVWKDNNSLYIAGVNDAPNSSRSHYLYALYLLDNEAIPEQNPTHRNELFDETVNEFKASLDYYPKNFNDYLNHKITINNQDKQLLVETYKMIAITYRHKGDTANTNLYANKASAIEAIR